MPTPAPAFRKVGDEIAVGVLDVHGGAWNAKNRTAEEPMDRAIAGSGVLVVAVDLTLAPEAPYPRRSMLNCSSTMPRRPSRALSGITDNQFRLTNASTC